MSAPEARCSQCGAPVETWTDEAGRRFRDARCDSCLQAAHGPAAVLWRLLVKGRLDHVLQES